MAIEDFMLSEAEMDEIAKMMAAEIKGSEKKTISRYHATFKDTAELKNGKKKIRESEINNFNRELVDGHYWKAEHDITPTNFRSVVEARNLNEFKSDLPKKKVELPNYEKTFMHRFPTEYDIFDESLKEITERNNDIMFIRRMVVDHKIIVNSDGLRVMQRVPFFELIYKQGYDPLDITRAVSGVCLTNKHVKNSTKMIKFISDPSPEGLVKKSKNFADAFETLASFSKLEYKNLESAGMKIKELYDPIVLTATPAHEIFGHHFEEPFEHIKPNSAGTFRLDQDISNEKLRLYDDATKKIAGFHHSGFTHFDEYGRMRKRVDHIKKGKVVGFLGSEYVDSEKLKDYINVSDNNFVGNARQCSYGSFPQPRMSCTVIEGKTTQDREFEGRIVTVPLSGETDDKYKAYVVISHESYIVKDGIPRRIAPLQISGGINQALANLEFMDDWTYNIGDCSKGDIVTSSSAEVPVSHFGKSQVWKGQQIYPAPFSDGCC